MSTRTTTYTEVQGRRQSLLGIPAITIIVLLLLTPLAIAVVRSLQGPGGWSLASYAGLFEGTFIRVLLATLGFASLVSGLCILLGVPTTYTLLRATPGQRRWLLLVLCLPFFAGTLVRSYAWLSILGPQGLINSLLMALGLDQPLHLAYSYPSLILASVQLELPLFILPLYGTLQHYDRNQLKAAHSLGADPVSAWFGVFLPAAIPGICTSTALVWLSALGFFVTPALLGPPNTYLLSQELDVRINTLGDHAGAAARVVFMFMLILIAVGLTLWLRRLAQRQRANPLLPLAARRCLEALARQVAPFRWWLALGCVVLVVSLLLVPLLVLLPMGISNADYLGSLSDGWSLRWARGFLTDSGMQHSTVLSLTIAAAAAGMSTFAGASAALAARGLSSRAGIALALLCCCPLAISAITVTAALFLLTLHLPSLDPFWPFVAVYTVIGLPFGFLLSHSALGRLDSNLARVAASLGAAPRVYARTVLAPLLAPSLAAAFAFAFVTAIDDVSAGLFLSSSQRMPLAMRLWENLKYAVTPQPAAVALLAMLAGAGIWLTLRLAAYFNTVLSKRNFP